MYKTDETEAFWNVLILFDINVYFQYIIWLRKYFHFIDLDLHQILHNIS